VRTGDGNPNPIALAKNIRCGINIKNQLFRLTRGKRGIVLLVGSAPHLIKAGFELALDLATQLDFLFEKGNFDQRRLLRGNVLKRLYVEEGRINRAELNAPFDVITRANGSGAVPSGGAEVSIGRTIKDFDLTFSLSI